MCNVNHVLYMFVDNNYVYIYGESVNIFNETTCYSIPHEKTCHSPSFLHPSILSMYSIALSLLVIEVRNLELCQPFSLLALTYLMWTVAMDFSV
jgi:hypothetical protein